MTFRFDNQVRTQLEDMVTTPQFQALTKIPLLAPMEVGLGLLAFVLFATSTFLYLDGTLPLPVMWLLNGFAVYLSFTPLHDATHRTVSRHRGLNDVIGTICCLLLLPGVTTGVYRYLHLEHHRYAGNASKDPDEPFVSAPGWALPFVLAGLDLLWARWYLRHWSSRPYAERVEFTLGMLFYVAVHVAFLVSPYAMEFVLCFVVPQRLGLFGVSWFFAHIQHIEGVEWEQQPLQTTYKIRAGWLVDLLMLGQATHCIHHLAPSVPFYRYGRAWRIGREIFGDQVPQRSLWRKPPLDDVAHPAGSAYADGVGMDNHSFAVEIHSTGEELLVEPHETLIDVLHEHGYPVMCSCTQGVCGSCLTPVLEGEIDHRDVILSPEDRAANDCMTVCVSRAAGSRLVLDL